MFRTFQRALLAALFVGLGTTVSQAALIVGFKFTDGTTNKVVPETGGTYVVQVIASTDNPATTNIGFGSGYIGALSSVLNGSTIAGNITARSGTSGYYTFSGATAGSFANDVNGDGHKDLGFANGTDKTTAGWMRPNVGTTPLVQASGGGPTQVLGTFTVTIPAYSGGNGLNFLSYLPQLDPSGAGNDFAWSENSTGQQIESPPGSGDFVTDPGTGISGFVGSTLINNGFTTNVIAGSSISFSSVAAIPEPSTLALGGVLALGLAGFGLRRKKNQA